VIAAAIPDAMLLPTDECFAQKVPEPVCNGLSCPKYALWDSNPGSWLAKEQKSRLHFGVRQLSKTGFCNSHDCKLYLVTPYYKAT
jgi:hypothetical protein